jgi:hypothetical protein
LARLLISPGSPSGRLNKTAIRTRLRAPTHDPAGDDHVDVDPVAGIPYVADTFNHRIQVSTASARSPGRAPRTLAVVGTRGVLAVGDDDVPERVHRYADRNAELPIAGPVTAPHLRRNVPVRLNTWTRWLNQSVTKIRPAFEAATPAVD